MRDSKRDTDVQNRLLDSVGVRVGEGVVGMILENGIEICILSCKKKLPVQFRYRIQDAWGWCTGMTQRDDMGREVGAGFRIGNSCTPVMDSCQCMAKPILYCKVKFKKNNKIFKKESIISVVSHNEGVKTIDEIIAVNISN